MTIIEAALQYAARGWPVFPVWGWNADGTCRCGRRDQADTSRASQWNESGRASREEGRRVAPRMTLAASTDQAMAMADRWNRIFCRTLRALRDLRRYSVTVNIQGPGQVNVGRGGSILGIRGCPKVTAVLF